MGGPDALKPDGAGRFMCRLVKAVNVLFSAWSISRAAGTTPKDEGIKRGGETQRREDGERRGGGGGGGVRSDCSPRRRGSAQKTPLPNSLSSVFDGGDGASLGITSLDWPCGGGGSGTKEAPVETPCERDAGTQNWTWASLVWSPVSCSSNRDKEE